MYQKRIATVICFAAIAFSAQASSITVDLGPSAQNFIEFGEGGISNPSGTFGTYFIQQGSCTAAAGTTTCTLSGDLASGGSPGFTSGTYSFITTFATSDVDPIRGIISTPDPGSGANDFAYSFLAPDVSMTLDLNTTSGMFVEPLFTDGNFTPGTDFSFMFTGNTCSGTPVPTCDPAHVGLVSGAILEDPVRITAILPTPTPEPRFLALTGLMVLLFGAFHFRRKSKLWAAR